MTVYKVTLNDRVVTSIEMAEDLNNATVIHFVMSNSLVRKKLKTKTILGVSISTDNIVSITTK